jgi:hypothetical protein
MIKVRYTTFNPHTFDTEIIIIEVEENDPWIQEYAIR